MVVAKDANKLELDHSYLMKWVRYFAQNTHFIESDPVVEKVRQAIAAYLPDRLAQCSKASVQELLDAVGIMAIAKIGGERLAWTATTSSDEAETLQQLYNSVPYSKIRSDLGINAHWIFVVNPKFIETYFSEDLYEAHLNVLEIEERPECVVVPL